jgi:hypothetical protein
MTIQCAQVDRVDRSASRAAHPQEPITGRDRGADRGEKIIGARNAWRSFQAAIRRSPSSSTWASVARRVAASFFRGVAALILHLAAVDAHRVIVARCPAKSSGFASTRSPAGDRRHLPISASAECFWKVRLADLQVTEARDELPNTDPLRASTTADRQPDARSLLTPRRGSGIPN